MILEGRGDGRQRPNRNSGRLYWDYVKKINPHFHILQLDLGDPSRPLKDVKVSDGVVIAIVFIWEYSGRNVILPYCFNTDATLAKKIGKWMDLIQEDLLQNQKPLYIRDHYGHELEVDKEATVQSFYF